MKRFRFRLRAFCLMKMYYRLSGGLLLPEKRIKQKKVKNPGTFEMAPATSPEDQHSSIGQKDLHLF